MQMLENIDKVLNMVIVATNVEKEEKALVQEAGEQMQGCSRWEAAVGERDPGESFNVAIEVPGPSAGLCRHKTRQE